MVDRWHSHGLNHQDSWKYHGIFMVFSMPRKKMIKINNKLKVMENSFFFIRFCRVLSDESELFFRGGSWTSSQISLNNLLLNHSESNRFFKILIHYPQVTANTNNWECYGPSKQLMHPSFSFSLRSPPGYSVPKKHPAPSAPSLPVRLDAPAPPVSNSTDTTNTTSRPKRVPPSVPR